MHIHIYNFTYFKLVEHPWSEDDLLGMCTSINKAVALQENVKNEVLQKVAILLVTLNDNETFGLLVKHV